MEFRAAAKGESYLMPWCCHLCPITLFLQLAHPQAGLPDWKGVAAAVAWADRADHVLDIASLALLGNVPDRVRMVNFVREGLAANLPDDFEGRGQMLDKLRILHWAEQNGGDVTRLSDLFGPARLEVMLRTGASTHEEFVASNWRYKDPRNMSPVTPAGCALSCYGTRGGQLSR
jgi:hypothetical protein